MDESKLTGLEDHSFDLRYEHILFKLCPLEFQKMFFVCLFLHIPFLRAPYPNFCLLQEREREKKKKYYSLIHKTEYYQHMDLLI